MKNVILASVISIIAGCASTPHSSQTVGLSDEPVNTCAKDAYQCNEIYQQKYREWFSLKMDGRPYVSLPVVKSPGFVLQGPIVFPTSGPSAADVLLQQQLYNAFVNPPRAQAPQSYTIIQNGQTIWVQPNQ